MKTQYKIFVIAVWMLSSLCANTSSQVIISCVNILNNLIKVDSFRAKIDYTNCVSLHRDKQIYYLVTRIKPAGELVPNRCSKVIVSSDGNKLLLSEWTATASIFPISGYDCMMIMKMECDVLQHCKTIWMLNKNPPLNSSQPTKEPLCDLTNLVGNITSSVFFKGVNICDAAINTENSSMFIKSCEPRSVLLPTPNGRYDCLLSVRENGIVENFLVKVNNQFQFVRYNLTSNLLVLSRCPQVSRCPSKEDEWTRNGLVTFKKRLTTNLNMDESLFIINVTSKQQPPPDFLIDASGNSTNKNTTQFQLPTTLNSTRPPNGNNTANQTASQQTTASAPTITCKPMYRLDYKTKQCVVNVERLLPALIISALIVLAVSILLLLVNFCRSENSAQVHKSVSKLYLAMNSKEEI
ncbi:hypothetical protein HELRODRAFT_190705 [Helobdella robusta]|uniref:ZP domain-containing protein n=1 Tax=Helobdella robusta TaxID=6412 RepID=T1FS79_HELRO|nr:hypothetical protein HELRODRAFT_190705 [Helobdella robusta]ESO09070.1 hypothetical protein HELRODRAFT_190705 [Helobdella robusta]